MFLNESELTERKAFIESFVKIVVMSGQSRGALRDSDAGRQPNTKERRRGGGAERLSPVCRQVWWTKPTCSILSSQRSRRDDEGSPA